QRDVAAAAEWARTLRDPRVQQQSVSIAVGQWARNDAEAAQRWAIGLPRGPLRDAALTSFLSSTIAGGGLDARALAAYSSDTARQQGVSQVIVQLGRSNVEQARNLVAAHLTDPDLRRSAEEQLARSGGTGGFRGGISEVIINSVFR